MRSRRARRTRPARTLVPAFALIAAVATAVGTTGCRPAASDRADVAVAPQGGSAGGSAGAAPAPSEPNDPEGRALLDRIVAAETTLAYHGYRSVSRGPAGASRESRLRVIHTADGRTRVEWAPKPDEAPVRRWSAESRHAWVRRPDLLLRNYRVVADPAPSPPVAWRDTRRVRIEGRRPGRPSLDLLVDAETSLVLAETGRDFDGREWLRARFETLTYGDPPADEVADAPEGLSREHTLAGRPEGLPALSPGVLPAGFELVDAHVPPCDPKAWVEDYSDGLAGISVTVSPAGADAPAEGEVRRSSRLGGGTLAARSHGALAMVCGSLADEELLSVLRGLLPSPVDR